VTWNTELQAPLEQFDQTFHLFAVSIALSLAFYASFESHTLIKEQLLFFISGLTALAWWGYFAFYGWAYAGRHTGPIVCEIESSDVCNTRRAVIAGYGIMVLGQSFIAVLTARSIVKDTLNDAEAMATGSGGQALVAAAH